MPEINLIDIILIIVIAAAVIAAAVHVVQKKKRGGCSCGCAGCAYSGSCTKAGKASKPSA